MIGSAVKCLSAHESLCETLVALIRYGARLYIPSEWKILHQFIFRSRKRRSHVHAVIFVPTVRGLSSVNLLILFGGVLP